MNNFEYLLDRQSKGLPVGEERIVCAANLFEDGTVVLGVRHCCEVMLAQAKAMGKENLRGTKQGFYTNWWRWVDREQAMKIAKEQGQLYRLEGTNNPLKLFSECLY